MTRIRAQTARWPRCAQRHPREGSGEVSGLFFGPQRKFFDDAPLMLGSNDWVVSGAHTVRANRCSQTICIWATRCLTCGTRLICAA